MPSPNRWPFGPLSLSLSPSKGPSALASCREAFLRFPHNARHQKDGAETENASAVARANVPEPEKCPKRMSNLWMAYSAHVSSSRHIKVSTRLVVIRASRCRPHPGASIQTGRLVGIRRKMENDASGDRARAQSQIGPDLKSGALTARP